MTAPQHLSAKTTHVRRGTPPHSFTHSVDYLLVDPAEARGLWLFSRNRFNLISVLDRDHGGEPKAGRGAEWAWQILAGRGLERTVRSRLMLLTQPRFLGYGFNPVSFWLRFEGEVLVAVIAEVNNTFGDRHSYLCAHPKFAAISSKDRIVARKVFHVSPFQEIAGEYTFGFRVADDRVAIRIDFLNGDRGLNATLTGELSPLTNASILKATIFRPFGAARTISLIYWHALRLKLKGASHQTRPAPPIEEVSR